MQKHGFLLLQIFLIILFFTSITQAQGAKQTVGQGPRASTDGDYTKQRDEWFYRGRIVRGQPSAALRRRAYQAKVRLRAQRAAALALTPNVSGQVSLSTGSWIPLGPVPLASDASGNGTQDYHQVAGRATAVAIDPADSTGNTVYIGGAQSGVWKSTNAASNSATDVTWAAVADDQATLSIGSIAIQPGNTDPAKSVVLAATGEDNGSSDSYFGLGILRSTNGGSTWSLIGTANNGALSFSGLGGTHMVFNSAAGKTNTAVSAMATSNEGLRDGAVTSNTSRGLYTSLDAGQTWTYDALVDPGGATDATSATSVVYNAGAALFFAAVRYHGFYSSSDGTHWTRLASQPGGAVLSTTACPPQSISNGYACPIYRGEITVVPGRNEMYAWYVSFSASGSVVDGGIWQSSNGGASWISISGAGIANCGDVTGCCVQQGGYNLELLAVPNGSTTDLYAGAVNIYKCGISSLNPTCAASPFINLTHVYGCVPIGAPAHVHPDQHALAYTIPTAGADSGNELLYFANDGGMYRALNGFLGLNTGSCSGTNQFDDLNQNLGSMTQFVSFSQHPTDANTLLGGAQDNGSPASGQATTNPSWANVLGGDGGYNAIDLGVPTNFYASNPDVPPAGLAVQLCTSGVNCTNGGFNAVATSNDLGGDDGGFYFPYVLDVHSSTAMLVGTCRVWRGPRSGGVFTALSPSFDTLGSGTCTGNEVNQVRALAVAGQTDANGSGVIYATTSGLGPINGPLDAPVGGRVWVTTDATAGPPAFVDVTNNEASGNINPNQFPISSVAADLSDLTGQTAYVTVMGFTGGAGHVWKTTNAGATWTDFTANLPDSPVNAVVVYPGLEQVYVGTDVGVFGSSTTSANWTELGPLPSSDIPGYLPNVAVTALGVFASGGQQLLRASTYGRGIWQFNLVITPDFQLSVSNSAQTAFVGQTVTFSGTASALNGYASSATLSCVSGATSAPSTCSPSPSSLIPGTKTPFSVTAGGAAGDYTFSIQGAGSDTNQTMHSVPATLHMINFGLTTPTPNTLTVPRGSSATPVSFQVTAAGAFDQSVAVACSVGMANATCDLTPGIVVNPTAGNPVAMTATVNVPSATLPGTYPATIQATTVGAPSPLTVAFTLTVIANPDFVLSQTSAFPEINIGSSGSTGPILIASQDGFAGTVTLQCPTTFGAGSCNISPTSVSSFPTTATLTINGTAFAAGSYSLSLMGTSGSVVHTLAVPFNVGDYTISGAAPAPVAPGTVATASLKFVSVSQYGGSIAATCDVSSLPSGVCSLSPSSTVVVTAGGSANLTVSVSVPNGATPGTYNIAINSQDSTGTPSHAFTVPVIVAQDFAVKSSTTSQTVTAGQTSGPYNLLVQPVGGSFTGTVTLTCSSGLPSGAQCAFSPSTPVTPGISPVQVVMSISTSAKKAVAQRPGRHLTMLYATWLFAPAIFIGWGALGSRWRKRKSCTVGLAWAAAVLMFSLLSCGDGGTAITGAPPPPNDKVTIYQVTVTGTSAGTASDAGQSVVVTLVVNSAVN